MTVQIEVIGDEEFLLYKHLNKQYSNLKRIIITKDILISSFEGGNMERLFKDLMNSPPDQYNSTLENAKSQEIFNGVLKNELYKSIQERLSRICENLNVQLKDYTFMNSISNSKFTVLLRCDQFSTRIHYIEKGGVMSAIRNLIQKYLEFPGNIFRLGRLEKFQIEIFETEEVFKHVYLKKEDNKLVLYSAFGFHYTDDIDYSCGGEFYFSIGENFSYYKNKQQFAYLRENTKIVQKEINPQDKVLTNGELMIINNQTKLLSDVFIEGYLTQKGNFKIYNVSLVESIPAFHSEEGFVLHKSSKNYNKISLVGPNDSITDDNPNPNYLLIRNENELKQFLGSHKIFRRIDGIVFNYNTFNSFIEHVGQYFDLDVIYYDKPLNKTLETNISFDPLRIESASVSQSQDNPFKSIIQEENKTKDELLERLKNIDLSTPRRPAENSIENKRIQSMTEGLISSPESGTAKQSSGIGWGNTPSLRGSGQKKSAMQMLADIALNKDNHPPKPQINESSSFIGEFSQGYNHQKDSEIVMKDVKASDLEPLSEETLSNTTWQIKQAATQGETMKANVLHKYEKVLATKILTPPNIPSSAYLTDINSLSQIQNNGKVYFVTTKVDQPANPNITYVVPITIEDQISRANYLLINRLEDFFLINDSKAHKKKFFINISQLPPDMKLRAIREGLSKLDSISVILYKTDLELIKDYIDKIEEVHIKDLSSEEELLIAEREILGFEKKHLLKRI